MSDIKTLDAAVKAIIPEGWNGRVEWNDEGLCVICEAPDGTPYGMARRREEEMTEDWAKLFAVQCLLMHARDRGDEDGRIRYMEERRELCKRVYA